MGGERRRMGPLARVVFPLWFGLLVMSVSTVAAAERQVDRGRVAASRVTGGLLAGGRRVASHRWGQGEEKRERESRRERRTEQEEERENGTESTRGSTSIRWEHLCPVSPSFD